MSLPPVAPLATLADLHPPATVFAPRSSRDRTRWVIAEPFRLDNVTGHAVAVMGAMPLLCHRAVATAEGLAFLRASGLAPPSTCLTYGTEAEAVALARDYVGSGLRQIYIYPPPPGIDGDDDLVVPLAVYGYLNDKRNLPDLVRPDRVPPRRLVANRAAADGPAPGSPVFVKVSVTTGNGAGEDLRYCPDRASYAAARAWFAGNAPDVDFLVVEEEIRVAVSWCLSVAVLDAGVRYLGAAIQLFAQPGHQSGSRIDPANPPPGEAVAEVLAIGEKARRLGYRGIAGVDLGADDGGRIYVFDLNFRLNASTVAVLLHGSAAGRVGAAMSQSWGGSARAPLVRLLDRLGPFAESGRFLPTRFYDATGMSGGTSLVGGLLLGNDVADVDELAAGLDAALASLEAS